MSTIKVVVIATVCLAAVTFALPGDLVVISAKEVRPDEDAGLYYLGSCGAGYLYNGSSASLARVSPYRVLDRDARGKDYYIVWAPGWAGVTPAAFEHLGTVVRLSENEILVSLERGLGPGALRSVDHRAELIRLEPVTPVEWRFDGEEPPTKKDRRIEAAINTITAEEYAGYIQKLQDFRTRASDTKGNDDAAYYVRDFFNAQGLEAAFFISKAIGLDKAYYPGPANTFLVESEYWTIKRTKDLGSSWYTVVAEGADGIVSMFWLNASDGFVAGFNNVLAKTVDGGDSWESIEFAPGCPDEWYQPWALSFVNNHTGWIGGRAPNGLGFLYKTKDGGYTWIPQSTPGEFVPGETDFFDESYGWVAAFRSSVGLKSIFYTDDGGASWRQGTVPEANRIVDLAAATRTTAWAADRDGRLLKTTNGLNWNYVNTGIEGCFYNVEFPDPLNGYAAGSKLIKTTDGGSSWSEITSAPEITYDLLAFADKNYGVMGDGEGNHLYRTDDGGATFVSVIENLDLTIANVVGERRGEVTPEEIVIIGGHFDSVSDQCPSFCPGAEDNGSGTACAMAAARAFRNEPFRRTVRYVAFDAEEWGMIGSGAYAKHCAQEGEKIIAFLNADMVCYDEDAGARDDYSLACNMYTWLFDYLVSTGGLYGNDLIYDREEWISDHGPFWSAGYAAIGAIEGGVGPGKVMEYPYYHTTEDTLDKLHPALGVRFVRDYAAMFAHLAGISDVGVKDPRKPGEAAVPFTRPFAVYPNPYCYATSTGGVNFVGIKSPATVEIYDLAGRRVSREEVAVPYDECAWRPATPEGETLAPGVYIYRVEGQGQSKAGKVVVAK